MPLIFYENLSHISNLKVEYDYSVIILPHIPFLEIQLAGKNIKIFFFLNNSFPSICLLLKNKFTS